MKTVVLLMMVIIGAVIITSAQEPKTGNNFQQKKFNTVKTDSAEYFAISPKFKTYTSSIKILPFQKLPGDSFAQNNQDKIDFLANRQKSEFRMPVAGGGGHDRFNMPVFVPDSTVEYYIKNKRIDYVNPKEKKFK